MYVLEFVFNKYHSLHVGGFTGEQIDDLMTILYGDPRTRDTVSFTREMIDKVVEWHRTVTNGKQSEHLRYDLTRLWTLTPRVRFVEQQN